MNYSISHLECKRITADRPSANLLCACTTNTLSCIGNLNVSKAQNKFVVTIHGTHVRGVSSIAALNVGSYTKSVIHVIVHVQCDMELKHSIGSVLQLEKEKSNIGSMPHMEEVDSSFK